MKLLIALVLLLAAPALAAAQSTPSLTVAGETFVRAGEGARWPRRFIVFIRPGETGKDWTRRLTLHYFPDFSRTPQQMAGQLARAARLSHPNADPRISENVDTGDVFVTFAATAPGHGVEEVEAFRYARGGASKGIIAVQYAVRARGADLNAARQAELRTLLLDALREIDMVHARGFFADGPSPISDRLPSALRLPTYESEMTSPPFTWIASSRRSSQSRSIVIASGAKQSS